MRYNLTGLSIASTADPIETHEQLGGSGIVRNKALAIPAHLNGLAEPGPWASVEFVSLDPGEHNAVGEHTQNTDELYYLVEGRGTLTTNGVAERVEAGCLAIAPCGTTHTIRNGSATAPLSFLVVELHMEWRLLHPAPSLLNLAAALSPGEAFVPVRVGGKPLYPLVAKVDLGEHFCRLSGPWGALWLVELPPGARMDTYCTSAADHLLLLSGYCSALVTASVPARPGEEREEIRVDATGKGYQCVIVPAGVPHRIENRASGDYPARLLCLQVVRSDERSA